MWSVGRCRRCAGWCAGPDGCAWHSTRVSIVQAQFTGQSGRWRGGPVVYQTLRAITKTGLTVAAASAGLARQCGAGIGLRRRFAGEIRWVAGLVKADHPHTAGGAYRNQRLVVPGAVRHPGLGQPRQGQVAKQAAQHEMRPEPSQPASGQRGASCLPCRLWRTPPSTRRRGRQYRQAPGKQAKSRCDSHQLQL